MASTTGANTECVLWDLRQPERRSRQTAARSFGGWREGLARGGRTGGGGGGVSGGGGGIRTIALMSVIHSDRDMDEEETDGHTDEGQKGSII